MSVSSEAQQLIRFGVFEADLRSGELRKNGVRVKIQDLPFRALKLLLSRPNEVVTREEFRQALWPQDVFVDFDRGISSAIKRLRDALGDFADNPIFIETIDRRGYRWIAPTYAPEVEAQLPASDPEPKSEASPGLSSTSAWKLVYVLPVLTLLFVAWSFRSSHLAKAGNSLRGSLIAGTHHPTNAEARDLYLQGRYYWTKRTPDDLNKAVDYFTQAIVHDPGYADAYVGLADSYNLLREYTGMPSRDAYPRALAAARKAVELDDQSSQAHASVAFALFWGSWDAVTADREFRRSIELDPANATAHHWYANALGASKRDAEALAQIERAQALDPTSKSILADKGNILFHMGREQEASTLLERIENAEPQFVSPHRYLKGVYLDMGDYPNYLAEMKKEAVLTNDSAGLTVANAAEKGFAHGGARSMFASMRLEEQKLYDQGKLPPYVLAETCALEGDKESALKYLKTAYDQRDERVTDLEGNSAFSSMRDEPGFRQLVAEVGLPKAQLSMSAPSPR